MAAVRYGNGGTHGRRMIAEPEDVTKRDSDRGRRQARNAAAGGAIGAVAGHAGALTRVAEGVHAQGHPRGLSYKATARHMNTPEGLRVLYGRGSGNKRILATGAGVGALVGVAATKAKKESASKADVSKAARYYDPEHRRQRRLGAYESGLAGGGLAAAGTGGVRAMRDSKELRDTVVQSNPNPNAKKLAIKDLPKGKGKGALRVTRGNAALLAGGTAALAGAGLVRQKAEGRKFGIWR